MVFQNKSSLSGSPLPSTSCGCSFSPLKCLRPKGSIKFALPLGNQSGLGKPLDRINLNGDHSAWKCNEAKHRALQEEWQVNLSSLDS